MPQGRANQHKCFLGQESPSSRTVCRPDGIFKYSWAMWSQAKTPQRNHTETERVGAELNLDDNGLWNNQDLWCLSHLPSSKANRAPCWGIHQDRKRQQRTHWLLPQDAGIQFLYTLWTIQAALLKKHFFPLGIVPSLFPRIHTNPLAPALDGFITQF